MVDRESYTPSYNVTFVTAFIKIYDTPILDRDIEWRFNQFTKIAKSGIPICVFTSPEYIDTFTKYVESSTTTNIRIMPAISIQDTFVYSCFQKSGILAKGYYLPHNRNCEKDTIEYLLLMNAKTEFMQKAIAANPWKTTHFSWIDFNIAYIFDNSKIESTIMFLKILAQRTLEAKFLAIPGCWRKMEVYNQNNKSITEMIHWRFCGGFCLGDIDSILEMDKLYHKHFFGFLDTYNKLVWEVNFWAYIEAQYNTFTPIWYVADHNDTMITNFPVSLFGKCLSHMPSYIKIKYDYPRIEDGLYETGSSAYVCHLGKHYLNTRYMNYWLTDLGRYWIRDADCKIITKNMCSELMGKNADSDGFSVIPDSWQVMRNIDNGLPSKSCKFQGLEDIRLYSKGEQLRFIATSINYSSTDGNRMIVGDYNVNTGELCNMTILEPPVNTWCEKNWIPIKSPVWFDSLDQPRSSDDEFFIYKWSPMMIGQTHANSTGNQLDIQIVYDTSTLPLFNRVRGSTIFVDYVDTRFLVGLVHFSEEGEPRKYYHILVLLEKDTYKPVGYSETFYFENRAIEFCIGMAVCPVEMEYSFWISQMDRDASYVRVKITDIPICYNA